MSVARNTPQKRVMDNSRRGRFRRQGRCVPAQQGAILELRATRQTGVFVERPGLCARAIRTRCSVRGTTLLFAKKSSRQLRRIDALRNARSAGARRLDREGRARREGSGVNNVACRSTTDIFAGRRDLVAAQRSVYFRIR